MANLHRAFAPHVAGKVAFKQIDKTATLDAIIPLIPTTVAKNLEHVMLDEQIVLTLTSAVDVFPTKAVLDTSIALTSATATDVSRVGLLDQTLGLTLVGQGSYGSNATVDATISLTLVGQARIPIPATLNRSLLNLVTLTGVGKVLPLIATLDENIIVTLAGQAQLNDGKLNEPIVLTSTTTTTQKFNMNVAATLPLPTIVAVEENTPPNFNTLPLFTTDGFIINGNVSDTAATLPMFTIDIDLGHDTDVTLPALISEALLIPGNDAVVVVPLPPLTITSLLESQVLSNAASTLPVFDLAAEIDISGQVDVTGSLPLFQIECLALSGNVADIAMFLPVLTGTGFLAENGIATLTAALPALYSNGLLDNGQTPVFNPFAMNTENYSVTQYTNYNFHSVFERAGKHYGVSTSGIYELVGTKDITTDIDASFKLGFSDMRKAGLKRVPYVYMGYKSDGDMKIDVSIDGEPAVRQYTIGNISNTSGIKRGRAKIARGLKSRYWQFGASNVAGSDFEIDKLGFYVQQFDRKAQ